MAIAGHVSRRMLERYSHVRLEAKRAAVQVFSTLKKEGYVTKYVTKQALLESSTPQMAEKTGRPERTRTVDLPDLSGRSNRLQI